MADNDSGEKTEQPTGRRVNQARGEGMVGKSVELSQVLSISAAFLLINYSAPRLWSKLIVLFQWGMTSSYGTKPMSLDDMRTQFYSLLYFLTPEILLILLLTAVVGSIATLLQTNFLWAPKLFKPNFGQLNPIKGLKRIFSTQNAVQILKSLAKLCIIGPVAYYGFFEIFPTMFTLMDMPIDNLLPFAGAAFGVIFWRIMKLMLALAILDLIYQKWRVAKQMKMSKNEVKEEKMSTEGDERTRLKIRQKAMQRARQRMMQAVKTADVVVTNPTHFAVALLYTMEKGVAPKVVAKGKDFMALKIKEIAQQNGVPVIERKPLARALYKAVEVGQEIPYELFAAVAEILAYVYRLKGKNPFKRKQTEKRP